MQDVKTVVNKTAEGIKNAIEKTEEFIQKVVVALQKRIRKVGEALENCTCHIVDKIDAKLEQIVKDIETGVVNASNKINNAVVNEVNKIKNATKLFWDQTHDGFILAERKVAGWFDRVATTAANKTILIWVNTRNAFQRDADWFKKLLKCNKCTNEYKPVCIRADNGEKATMLNQCYAECGELVIQYPGRCLGDSEAGETLAVDLLEL